jgi:hypothetical protein
VISRTPNRQSIALGLYAHNPLGCGVFPDTTFGGDSDRFCSCHSTQVFNEVSVDGKLGLVMNRKKRMLTVEVTAGLSQIDDLTRILCAGANYQL